MSIDTADPFAQALDTEDPFATPEDVKPGTGGDFKPSPKPEDLEGALIVMVPRAHDAKAKKLERFVKAGEDPHQERWTVDLYVLEGKAPGADLAFWYQKRDRDNPDATPDLTEYVIASANMPEMFGHTRIYQWSIIGQMNKIADSPRPLLMGRVVRGPKAADARKGKTVADVAKEFAAWERTGRKTERPGFTWIVDTATTPEDRQKAVAWFAQARESLALDSLVIKRTTEPLS